MSFVTKSVFYLTITVMISLVMTSLPMRSMGADIHCQIKQDCIGTQEIDNITATGIGPYGVIKGLEGDDFIQGSQARDRIEGGRGTDLIWGGNGDDLIIGTPEFVTDGEIIDGEKGNDTIITSSRENTNGRPGSIITGSIGSDLIIGGLGVDLIYGGPGDDVIYSSPDNLLEFSNDTIDCGSGNDTAYIRSSFGDIAKSNCEDILDYDG